MNNSKALKHYVTLNNGSPWQIHYRSQGQGKPVILLHPSPLSSNFMLPMMNLLAENNQVFAWDAPGYGQSDPLPENGGGLAPYVDALKLFIDALNLKDAVIYGSATGAQIAIEYAKAYPNSINGIVLENAAWFYDEEREEILKQYFPDIEPKEDGSHLTLVWKIASQLYHYFPWFDTSENARVSHAEIPAALKHQTLMEYFTAGKNYHLAYEAAFMNERPEQLAKVTIPTHLIRWESSMLKPYVDRLDKADLPANIEMKHADASIENRFATLQSSVKTLSDLPEK
jgi:pimeloyl-ACP methyl ester carboxylesterase